MILLDTNILIDIVTANSPQLARVAAWINDGVRLSTSAIAWSEFLNGPHTKQQKNAIYAILGKTVLAFNEQQAEKASKLFHLTGRKRGSHADCMIAATAITHNIPVATRNTKDFEKFTPFGLQLQAIPTL